MKLFAIKNLPLVGLKLLTRNQIGDARGFLSRIFCIEELASIGWHKPIFQINHTYTEKRGSIRGMHFQYPPYMEMKLVSCIRGAVWDVVIDIRAGSKNFLQWHAEKLSFENRCALFVPEGFAHGFQALTDNVELLYCHSNPYMPKSESGINPLDPMLNIKWPLEISTLSLKDIKHNMLNNKFIGL